MYRIITIERQFASGGHEIGRRVAKELGYEFYNQEILAQVAKKLQIPAMYIGELEEASSGSKLLNLSQSPLGGSNKKKGKVPPMAEQIFLEEKNIIENISKEGPCVIVGRSAGYILKDREDCLNVFIHADKEARLRRAIEFEKIKAEEAEAALKKMDKRRKEFYKTHTEWSWGEKEFFELCLDSGTLGLDLCTELLVLAAKKD